MDKIDKLINELCPNGVEFKKLGDICISLKKGTLKTEELSDKGKYHVINSGRDWYGRYHKYNNEGNAISIAARGEYAGFVNYISEDFWAGGLCYPYRSKDERIIKTKYIFYVLKNRQQNIMETLVARGSIPALNKLDLDKFLIPIPHPKIQNEIINILNRFTELESELEAELEARKKQYEYYRETLLTFGNDVKFIDLSEVYKFQYGEGNTIPKTGGEFPVYGSNGIVGSHHKYNSENSPVIGHIGAYAGIVNWASGKHFVTYNGVICTIKDGIHPRFGYHLLKKQNLRELAKDGSQPFVSYDKLNTVKVQIPSPEQQQKIAELLDKFDDLVNDISIGLPGELELRRKQYDYYRNKLLTFKGANIND